MVGQQVDYLGMSENVPKQTSAPAGNAPEGLDDLACV
jgi:hypothetical protein